MDESNLVDAQIIESLRQEVKELQCINQKNIEQFKQLDTDSLTGLLTKEAFFKSVRKMLDTYTKDEFLFFRFDIDKFQTVNTLFGYEGGDSLLKYCANSLQKAVHCYLVSVVGRIDADIFCICIKVDPEHDINSMLYTDINDFLKGY